LNAVEKGRILRRLRDHFHYAPARLIETFCPLLDIPPLLASVEAYCTLTTLDDALQAAVVAERLSLDTAVWIGRQVPEDRQALRGLFTRLGTNRPEFVAAIEDMCRRDGWRCDAVTARGVSIVGRRNAEPQKAQTLRRLLHAARYPCSAPMSNARRPYAAFAARPSEPAAAAHLRTTVPDQLRVSYPPGVASTPSAYSMPLVAPFSDR
jgi:hypothetical protein